MLVSKSNGFNASAVLGSGSYNENKSSKHMELLAHSIVKLICKEAASATYRGALETLQKMMSECIYHEGNAFVIMGSGEQLKRIKYDVDENNLKVFNVYFDNNEELVTDGEPDVVCLSKQVWEDLLIKLKLENKENAVSETDLSSNKNNVDHFFQSAKRDEQTLFGNIRKSEFHVDSLKPGSTRSVILETQPNVSMEPRNLYDNQIDKVSPVTKNSQQVKGHYGDKLKEMQMFLNQMSNALQQAPSLSESKEHTIDIQKITDAFVKEFRGILFDKNGNSSERLFNFYECCYIFLPRAQPQDKIESYNSALQAFSIFRSSTLNNNDVGFNFKLFPEVKPSGENLETVFKYKKGSFVREIARINITLQKGEGGLYNLGGLDFKGCFFSGQNFRNYDIKNVNWRTSLFDVDAPCIFNVPDDNKSYEKLLKSVSENGLNGVLSDRNNKIKLITGVAPFDDILFMDDDFDDSSSEDDPVENSPVVNSSIV
ncbi:YpjCB family protein [Escherichia coli]